MAKHTEQTGLAVVEKRELDDLESRIERGLETFVDVGNALLVIREKRLYRVDHDSFENYCRDRWNFTGRRANQLIDAAGVVAQLEDEAGVETPLAGSKSEQVGKIFPTAPTVESHAAELSKVAPERRQEVWSKTLEDAPKDSTGKPRPTAEGVRKAAGIDPPERPKPGRRDEPREEVDDGRDNPPLPPGPSPQEQARNRPEVRTMKLLTLIGGAIISFHDDGILSDFTSKASVRERRYAGNRVRELIDELSKIAEEMESSHVRATAV